MEQTLQFIQINGFTFPADWLTGQEPGLALMDGATFRKYIPKEALHSLQNNQNAWGGEVPWELGDRLIDNVQQLWQEYQLSLIPPPPTQLEKRNQLINRLEASATQKLAAPIAQYPTGEQLSWNAKEQEAKAFLATDDLSAAPTLTVEVRAYYTSDLATGVRERSLIILQKAEELKRLSAAVVGARTRLKREIAAMSELDMDGFDVEQALSDAIASALSLS